MQGDYISRRKRPETPPASFQTSLIFGGTYLGFFLASFTFGFSFLGGGTHGLFSSIIFKLLWSHGHGRLVVSANRYEHSAVMSRVKVSRYVATIRD